MGTMGRPRRPDRTGYHHVVNRGVARQPIFYDVRDRVEFLRLLGVVHERFGVNIHAFALMTNHYHLVLECPRGGLTDAMHVLGSVFVRHVNERAGRDGPLFKDRYYAKRVETDDYLLRLVDYVHRNPLAMVNQDQLLDYRWSSLRVYSGDRRRPEWLRTDLVSGLIGGGEAVVEMATGRRDPPPMTIGLGDLVALIELMVDECVDERLQRGAVRTVAVGLLDRLGAETSKLLLDHLAFPSTNAERIARCRARQRMATDPTLVTAVDAVLTVLAGRFQFVPGTY
jgi:REP element-mobilizing transposase RayT